MRISLVAVALLLGGCGSWRLVHFVDDPGPGRPPLGCHLAGMGPIMHCPEAT